MKNNGIGKHHETGHLVDEAARILASPMPRRQAIKALSRVLTGSLLAAFGVRHLESQTATPDNSSTCHPACPKGQHCCPGSGRPDFCLSNSRVCCGNDSCGSNETCCTGTRGQHFCSTSGATCCGDTSCQRVQTCCTGTQGQHFCSTAGATCCGDTSCKSYDHCCTTGSRPFCAGRGGLCCGNGSCGKGQHCCGNSVCCGDNQACKDGRCQPSKA